MCHGDYEKDANLCGKVCELREKNADVLQIWKLIEKDGKRVLHTSLGVAGSGNDNIWFFRLLSVNMMGQIHLMSLLRKFTLHVAFLDSVDAIDS